MAERVNIPVLARVRRGDGAVTAPPADGTAG